ncbi:MAG: cation:proton antiporter [Candidatus Micrarchaeota archaeon]|nr:cation:proton antiporter [Candidatus Micrarchaeota archaeon]
MPSLFLFLGALFFLTLAFGLLLERWRIPWVFAALIIGIGYSVISPFNFPRETFSFLAELGMLFLLFVIGFEIDFRDLRKMGGFIAKSSLFIVFISTVFGAVVLKLLFGYDWFVSTLIAMSFATVGEAVLVPILDEFGLMRTQLGKAIVGIGVMDDVIEVFSLVLLAVLLGENTGFGITFLSLLGVIGLTFLLTSIKVKRFGFLKIESLFLFTVFVLFLFSGVGELSGAESMAALLAGMSLRAFIPRDRLSVIESEVKTMCYGFFAPIFFFWVGASTDVAYILSYPLLVAIVFAVSMITKIAASLLAGYKKLGKKQSLILGFGLCVRFSVSIVIIKILFEKGIIGPGLYSVMVASTLLFTFLVPIAFSWMVSKWYRV